MKVREGREGGEPNVRRKAGRNQKHEGREEDDEVEVV